MHYALYFRLQSVAIIESEEVRPGVILDFDENDRVIGVEFLRVSERASSEDLAVMTEVGSLPFPW
jgi:uncharacterized protein YuzE